MGYWDLRGHDISIHALRMERDTGRPTGRNTTGRFQSTRSAWSATSSTIAAVSPIDISIHALRMERDTLPSWILGRWPRFQSTRSAWSATIIYQHIQQGPHHFNPRAPHGARLYVSRRAPQKAKNFNPRAPHGARLFRSARSSIASSNFNPRAPHGARRPERVPVSYTHLDVYKRQQYIRR